MKKTLVWVLFLPMLYWTAPLVAAEAPSEENLEEGVEMVREGGSASPDKPVKKKRYRLVLPANFGPDHLNAPAEEEEAPSEAPAPELPEITLPTPAGADS